MRTLIPDPPPAEIEAVLERRRKTGADRHDEVWEGVLHMAPAARSSHGDVQAQVLVLLNGPARRAGLVPILEFNLGGPNDFRVPDGGLRRERGDATYLPTATLVVEIVSPGDETWEKLPFYAKCQVQEVWLVEPKTRLVEVYVLRDSSYELVHGDAAPRLGLELRTIEGPKLRIVWSGGSAEL